MEGVNVNRKKKQETRKKASTRQLMGIDDITGHSLVTPHGELVFFMIKPTNISVLSDSSIGARIYALMNVLKGISDIEILCLNSRELRGQQRLSESQDGHRAESCHPQTAGTGYDFP